MNFKLKPIHADAIPEALEKAERYRLLNEAAQAESICLDVLSVDPHHQQALIIMLLAITDQFGEGSGAKRAKEILPRLESEYDRAYYAGIICERLGHAEVRGSRNGSSYSAYELLNEAMKHYEEAERVRPPNNDDSILRWNTCARFLTRHSDLKPRPVETHQEVLGE
jgi:tetratricopeptide (TPR) repeat protein